MLTIRRITLILLTLFSVALLCASAAAQAVPKFRQFRSAVEVGPIAEQPGAFLCTAEIVDTENDEVVSRPKLVFLKGSSGTVQSTFETTDDDGNVVEGLFYMEVSVDEQATTASYNSKLVIDGEVVNEQVFQFRLPAASPKAAVAKSASVGLGRLEAVSRPERKYVGEPINMSLRNADLEETLRSFAAISGLNFVVPQDLLSSITVELKGVPWDQALEQILRLNNLSMEITGTIVRIAPPSEEPRSPSNLSILMKSLSYARASEVASLLRDRATLSELGTVEVDERTNAVIIREGHNNIDTVLAVLEQLDVPPERTQ